MIFRVLPAALSVAISVSLAACGAQVPEKDPFRGDPRTPRGNSLQANRGIQLIDHIQCELAEGLREAKRNFEQLEWLYKKWGVAITLTITAEDQTGLSPGISTISPLPNVLFPFSNGVLTAAQSFSFNLGGTASVNALRTETIKFTLRDNDVFSYGCNEAREPGFLIDGDLKLRDFIFDKAAIANSHNLAGNMEDETRAVYNAWSEEITFVGSYGASATPTWKLARFSSGTSSNLYVTQRTDTNDLILTLGPLACSASRATPGKDAHHGITTNDQCQDKSAAVGLTKDAMDQHFARVQASAIAISITGQAH